MFKGLFGDKKWYESLTAWGLVIFAGTQAAVTGGILPPGADIFVGQVGELISGLFVILGLRRAGNK